MQICAHRSVPPSKEQNDLQAMHEILRQKYMRAKHNSKLLCMASHLSLLVCGKHGRQSRNQCGRLLGKNTPLFAAHLLQYELHDELGPSALLRAMK
jgi:hypothetical protein